MYKIKNISSGKVIINDLGLMLTSGQEVDLDSMFPRETIDASTELMRATDPKRNLIVVVHKDELVEKSLDPSMIEAMERRLRRTIANEIANISKIESSGTDDDVKNKLNLILDALSKGTIAHPAASTQEEKEHEISDESTVEIQKRLIERLGKNVQSRVGSKEEKKDSDVKKHADELEGLI